jgi:hypothetical protein
MGLGEVGVSAAFALLSSGENAQSLAMANELVLAYSERRQVLGQSAVSALSAGDNAQDKTLWLAMQNWLESNCTSFVDHINGPLNPAGTDFLYFTKATWQAAAGLNVSAGDGESFRRRVDPSDDVSYGHIATGDYRNNPDIFEDLQKGFGALKWSPRDVTSYTTGAHCEGDSGWYKETWAEAIEAAETAPYVGWHCQTTGGAGEPFAESSSYLNEMGYFAGCGRNKPYVHLNGLPEISRFPVLYASGKAYGNGVFNGNGDLTENFVDVDTLDNSTDAEVISSHFIGGEIPIWGPEPTESYVVGYTGYSILKIQWLLKWNFTNA